MRVSESVRNWGGRGEERGTPAVQSNECARSVEVDVLRVVVSRVGPRREVLECLLDNLYGVRDAACPVSTG